MMAGSSNRLSGVRVTRPTRPTRLAQPGSAPRGRSGYTLVELLAALVILSLMTAMVSTGVSAGARAYERAQFSSQADMLSATVNSALSDTFRFMYEDGDSYVVTLDGEKVAFAQGSSALQVDDEGRFRLVGSDVDKPLVNDGIYGTCQVSGVTMESCTMSGVKYSYSFTNGGSLTRTYSFTATPLQGVQRDRGVGSGSGSPSGGEKAEAADKTELNAEIARVEAIDLSGEETAPRAALQTALAAAKAVAENEGASQEEVDEAAAALAAARRAYENSQSGDSGLDLSAVEAAIGHADEAKPWKSDDAQAAANLQDAYDAAVNARNGVGVASQDDVASVAAALEGALQAYKDSIEVKPPSEYDVSTDPNAPAAGSGLSATESSYSSIFDNWSGFKWETRIDANGVSYRAAVQSGQVALIYYKRYYKVLNGTADSTDYFQDYDWAEPFVVGQLGDGKSHIHAYGSREWVAVG